MGPSTPVVVESTVLRCLGPHPYATRLPDRFGGRTHDVPVGFPVPLRCLPTGSVWRQEAAPSRTDPSHSSRDGRLLIWARCPCGAVTEYEVVRSDG